jgi:hypothetical protein
MNLKLLSIALECKRGNVEYQLNDHITAFYGNIGAGKTSLLNLISFCLGNDLVHTLAIDEEVRCCTLSVVYKNFPMSFSRLISSNYITIKSCEKEIQIKAKDAYRDDISDFFFEQEDIKQLFWLPQKNESIQKEVRITFANFYWFSYLNQDEIDSSLFYLKDSQNYYKQIASRSVLFNCFGGDASAESEIQHKLRSLSGTLGETKQKISYGKEILASTPLFSLNISNEILKKKQLIESFKEQLNVEYSKDSNIYNTSDVEKLLKIQYTIGLYEAEVKYLSVFSKVKTIIESQATIKQSVENELETQKREKDYYSIQNAAFLENLEIFKKLFLDTLKKVKFPGMEDGDYIKLSSKDFFPILYTFGGKKKADYNTLSSGGKKTIYKICYAIATHRLIKLKCLRTLIPNILIIDTPMKNISEREDTELYNALFRFLYSLFKDGGELGSTQLILVDKELHPHFGGEDITQYHLSSEQPLLPFYRT